MKVVDLQNEAVKEEAPTLEPIEAKEEEQLVQVVGASSFG
jgi:hypothetical protein